MKKLSPPRTERLRPAIRPPFASVSIVTPPDMLTIAPLTACTCSPPSRVIEPSEYAGPYLISNFMDVLLVGGTGQGRRTAPCLAPAGRTLRPAVPQFSGQQQPEPARPERLRGF